MRKGVSISIVAVIILVAIANFSFGMYMDSVRQDLQQKGNVETSEESRTQQENFPQENVNQTEVEETSPPETGKYETWMNIEELAEFQKWAEDRGIFLEGVSIDSNHAYYNGYDSETDMVDLKDVPGVLFAADALYKVPDNVLEAMREKTFYFSTQFGRSYTVLSSWPEQNILAGLNRGIIIEQDINDYTTIHELGHIVDFHGVQGLYEDKRNIFSSAKEKRDEVFKVNVEYDPSAAEPPQGYLTVYSTANDAENFAEHFAHYILYPEEFRQKAENDALIARKYNFLRDFIFAGKEF